MEWIETNEPTVHLPPVSWPQTKSGVSTGCHFISSLGMSVTHYYLNCLQQLRNQRNSGLIPSWWGRARPNRQKSKYSPPRHFSLEMSSTWSNAPCNAFKEKSYNYVWKYKMWYSCSFWQVGITVLLILGTLPNVLAAGNTAFHWGRILSFKTFSIDALLMYILGNSLWHIYICT